MELVDRTKDDTPGLRVPGLRVELTGPWAAYSFTEEPHPAEQTRPAERPDTVERTEEDA